MDLSRSKKIILLLAALLCLALYAYRFHFPETAYYDENHFLTSAREMLEGRLNSWMGIHSPVATAVIAFSIRLFGDVSWSWRLPSLLTGWISLGVLFLIVRQLTGHFWITLGTVLLFAMEGIHFTHSRMTNGISLMHLWMMLSLLAVLPYLMKQPVSRRLSFFLSGLFLGFAIATRWVGLGMIAVIWPLLVPRFLEEKKKAAFLADFVLFFLVLPALIYWLSHTALPMAENSPWAGFEARHKAMREWHFNAPLKHNYQSSWWGWPLLVRPFWFFFERKEGLIYGILCIGNPAIYWMIPFAVAYAVFKWIEERKFLYGVIVLGFFSQWLPWAWIEKTKGGITFFYYFYPSVPFAVLAIALLAHRFWQIEKIGKGIVIFYLFLIVLLFIYWYPLLTAFPISEAYFRRHLWFKSWI